MQEVNEQLQYWELQKSYAEVAFNYAVGQIALLLAEVNDDRSVERVLPTA